MTNIYLGWLFYMFLTVLDDTAPPDPDWSDIEHRLELILAEQRSVQPIWVYDVRSIPGLAIDGSGLTSS